MAESGTIITTGLEQTFQALRSRDPSKISQKVIAPHPDYKRIPKHNYAPTAAVETGSWGAGMSRFAASGNGIIYGQPQFFSPVHTPINWQIPSKRLEQYQWARFFYENEPKVASAIDFYCFVPETYILMGDGKQKTISSVKAGNIVRSHDGSINKVEKVYSKLNDQRYKDVRQQSSHDGWWDGAERYQFVNRNIISCIQRDDLFLMTQALCKHLGVGLGIGGTPISGVLHVNVGVDTCDVVVTDFNLPFEDNSVGYIVSSHTLEHIPETPDIVISEWLRILKPGGLIAITVPNKIYMKHDNGPHIKKYDYAYNEVEPSELKVYLDKITDKCEVLIFNTNQNNFDINVLIRKKGVTE